MRVAPEIVSEFVQTVLVQARYEPAQITKAVR